MGRLTEEQVEISFLIPEMVFSGIHLVFIF